MKKSNMQHAFKLNFCNIKKALQIQHPEKGQAALEYALIAVGVFIVILGAIQLLGGSIAGVFERAAAALGG